MDQIQKTLHTWFARTVKSGSTNFFPELPFVLGTDVGLVREENQDRAGALHFSGNAKSPIFAIAVADGMGGMKAGAECANLTISSFFFSLIQNRTLPTLDMAQKAVDYANREVAQFAKETGGATLSAVLFDKTSSPVIVHVGDSRIYTFGDDSRLNRKTIDDSMAEALGGSGRELLQFVGMGESINPKVDYLNSADTKCLITTDGIHRLDESTIRDILAYSSDLKQASERLMVLARWCGGKDNATSAMLNVKEITNNLINSNNNNLRLWDPFGELTIHSLEKEEFQSLSNDSDQVEDTSNHMQHDDHGKEGRAKSPKRHYDKKLTRKKNSSKSKDKSVQLKIEMDEHGSDGKKSDDSK